MYLYVKTSAEIAKQLLFVKDLLKVPTQQS